MLGPQLRGKRSKREVEEGWGAKAGPEMRWNLRSSGDEQDMEERGDSEP